MITLSYGQLVLNALLGLVGGLVAALVVYFALQLRDHWHERVTRWHWHSPLLWRWGADEWDKSHGVRHWGFWWTETRYVTFQP